MSIPDNPIKTLFALEDVSQHPVKVIQGVQVDFRRTKEMRYVVKKLFQIISNQDFPLDSNSFHWRICVVKYLENLLRTQFMNSLDLRRKVEGYLKNYEVRKGSVGDRIKKARKKSRLTQKQAAELLGFKSHVTFLNYERGKRFPPNRVFRWLEEVGE